MIRAWKACQIGEARNRAAGRACHRVGGVEITEQVSERVVALHELAAEGCQGVAEEVGRDEPVVAVGRACELAVQGRARALVLLCQSLQFAGAVSQVLLEDPQRGRMRVVTLLQQRVGLPARGFERTEQFGLLGLRALPSGLGGGGTLSVSPTQGTLLVERPHHRGVV